MAGLACSTSDVGLGGPSDSGVGQTGSVTTCLVGTIDRANWPAAADYSSCTMTCGPDDLGSRTCSQTDLSTCRSKNGCVCLSSPCVTCTDCAFSALPDCYVPLDADLGLPCAPTVAKGEPCSPACGRSLCIEADGTTGCVCNAQGKFACAEWGTDTWQ
jgi:hypothetical protein